MSTAKYFYFIWHNYLKNFVCSKLLHKASFNWVDLVNIVYVNINERCIRGIYPQYGLKYQFSLI